MNQPRPALQEFTIELNGKNCIAKAGETVVDVARREGIDIPTLCHDTRLEPAGACRVCLVEVDGQRRLQSVCIHPMIGHVHAVKNPTMLFDSL